MKPKSLWIIATFSVLICAALLFMKFDPSTVERFQSQIPGVKKFFLSNKDLFLKVDEIRDSKKNSVGFSLTRNPQNEDEVLISYDKVFDEKLKAKINYYEKYRLESSVFFTDGEKETMNQLFRISQNDISIMDTYSISQYGIDFVSRTDFSIVRMDAEALELARTNPYFIIVENIVDDWYITIFKPLKSLD